MLQKHELKLITSSNNTTRISRLPKIPSFRCCWFRLISPNWSRVMTRAMHTSHKLRSKRRIRLHLTIVAGHIHHSVRQVWRKRFSVHLFPLRKERFKVCYTLQAQRASEVSLNVVLEALVMQAMSTSQNHYLLHACEQILCANWAMRVQRSLATLVLWERFHRYTSSTTIAMLIVLSSPQPAKVTVRTVVDALILILVEFAHIAKVLRKRFPTVHTLLANILHCMAKQAHDLFRRISVHCMTFLLVMAQSTHVQNRRCVLFLITTSRNQRTLSHVVLATESPILLLRNLRYANFDAVGNLRSI
mmetsp:Transcript_44411/g.172584  ORF Transcript_44411/g.172584 Transcript_44411/m.172584 type:complete len:303 (-) Transcript_44411:493-1401(-)